jgi:hypothetical protein
MRKASEDRDIWLISWRNGGSCTKIDSKTKLPDIVFRKFCKSVEWSESLQGSASVYELSGWGSILSSTRHFYLLHKFQRGCGEQPAFLPRSCRVVFLGSSSSSGKVWSWSLTPFLVQIWRIRGTVPPLCALEASVTVIPTHCTLTRIACPHNFWFRQP